MFLTYGDLKTIQVEGSYTSASLSKIVITRFL